MWEARSARRLPEFLECGTRVPAEWQAHLEFDRPGDFLRRHEPWIIAALFVLVTYVDEAWQLHNDARLTGYLLLAVLAVEVVLSQHGLPLPSLRAQQRLLLSGVVVHPGIPTAGTGLMVK